LRNFGTAFQSGEQQRAIEVAVAVTRADGKNMGDGTVGLLLRNRARPSIGITPTDGIIRFGETAQIVVYFGSSKSPVVSPYRCAWVVGGKVDNSDSCSISYKAAARPDSPAKDPVDVRVQIHDPAGTVVGEATQRFVVVWPTGDFYIYAIETTQRMNSRVRGVTLTSSIAEVEKAILTKSLATGSVGIKVFGRADPPDDRTKCGLVDNVYDLAPLDEALVKEKLAAIKINGFRAPVLKAAAESMYELTKHAQHNVWLYLVMITGGPEGCPDASEQDTLNKIAAALRSTTAQVGPIEFQVLGLTLRLAATEEAPLLIESIWNSARSRGELPYFELVVTSQGVLNQALGAVAGLADDNAAQRRTSCLTLVNLLRQQPDLPPNLRERPNPQAE